MSTKEDNEYEEVMGESTDYLVVLDKMLELEKEKHKTGPIKITICIVGGILAVMFFALLCYRMVYTDLSADSILSTMLAFFSIFISIFFYFKADETSTSFYKSSYDIMKDVSVALGKIEERFGEKLNSLNDKVSHLDAISTEKTQEIQEQKQDTDKIIQDLMNKAKLDEKEKAEYFQQLRESEKRIERLKEERANAEREASLLRRRALYNNNAIGESSYISTELLRSLAEGRMDYPLSVRQKLRKYNYIDENGCINRDKVRNELQLRAN